MYSLSGAVAGVVVISTLIELFRHLHVEVTVPQWWLTIRAFPSPENFFQSPRVLPADKETAAPRV